MATSKRPYLPLKISLVVTRKRNGLYHVVTYNADCRERVLRRGLTFRFPDMGFHGVGSENTANVMGARPVKSVSFIYGPYCLLCEPVQLPDDGFGCVATIVAVGHHHVLARGPSPAAERALTEIDAVRAAKQWAVNWIRQRAGQEQSA